MKHSLEISSIFLLPHSTRPLLTTFRRNSQLKFPHSNRKRKAQVKSPEIAAESELKQLERLLTTEPNSLTFSALNSTRRMPFSDRIFPTQFFSPSLHHLTSFGESARRSHANNTHSARIIRKILSGSFALLLM